MDASAAAMNAIDVNDVSFSYQGCAACIQNCDMHIPKGSRCLLIGANGAGKSTLLQLLAGKYLVPQDKIRVLGRPPFHDLQLTCSGQLSYLGASWRKDVACAGYGLPLQGDISAGKIIFGIEGADPVRRAQLIRLLDIDLTWRLNKVSDGQRRRVQICMGLLKPYDVLMMDEITVDLDVLGRLALLDFFTQECEQRGATILYATHIFDGLESWITHVAYLEGGKLAKVGRKEEVPDIKADVKLLRVVEKWLREERSQRQAKALLQAQNPQPAAQPARSPFDSMPSRHMAYFR